MKDIDEVLALFPDNINKKELYSKNMLFNTMVHRLAHGETPYQCILTLIGVVKQQAELNTKLMMESNFPIMMHYDKNND